MNDVFLTVHEINVSFDGFRALSDTSFSLKRGEILGLMGPNGAGKTTVFNVISGILQPSSGEVLYVGTPIVGMSPVRISAMGIRRTFQNLRLFRRLSVLDNVLLHFTDQPGESLLNGVLDVRKSREREKLIRVKAMDMLASVGIAHAAFDAAETLSYGQQKLLNIVSCMAGDGKVLLLDEPVAGISPEMTDIVLKKILNLRDEGKSVILIDHNMEVFMGLCNRVIFIDAGIIVMEGTPTQVRNDPRVLSAYLG